MAWRCQTMTDEEKKAIERIEDFLTTNIISISSD